MSDSVGISWAMMVNGNLPITYTAAMDHPNANSWLEACSKELAALRETKTYVPIHIDDIDAHNIMGVAGYLP